MLGCFLLVVLNQKESSHRHPAYAVMTDEREAIDIDTETDFLIAEAILQVDPDD